MWPLKLMRLKRMLWCWLRNQCDRRGCRGEAIEVDAIEGDVVILAC